MDAFNSIKDYILLISMTSVPLILNKMLQVYSSMITQVAEHVIVQANVL